MSPQPATTSSPTPPKRGLHSQSLDLMRFPLAVVVLTVHVSVLQLTGQEAASKAFWKVVEVFLHDQSVPIYFFIAGYVFFLRNEMTPQQFKRKLHNRTKSLLIPYLIWNLLMILRVWLKSVMKDGEAFIPTPHNLLSCFWIYDGALEQKAVSNPTYPINLPLWFLRDLMIIVLATPLIYWTLRHTRHYFVLLTGAVWLFRWQLFSGHCVQLLTALFFFSWGAYMSVFQKDMIREFGRFKRTAAVCYPLLGIICWWVFRLYPDYYMHIKDLYVITGLCFAYNLSAWLLRKGIFRVSDLLSSASFFIYISHYLVCFYIAKAVFFLISPHQTLTTICAYITAIAATVLFLLGAFWLMKKFTPSLLRVIAGRK